jgi:cytidine deaminase
MKNHKKGGVGMYAEYTAVATMVTNGERNIIETPVVVSFKADVEYVILPLCRKCRDLASVFSGPQAIIKSARISSK